jgi:hypothetical protein
MKGDTVPARIETTLLVVERFTDEAGTEYLPGDRAPIGHRSVRRAAFEEPSSFAMEFETTSLDLDWLRELEQQYEGEYKTELRRREQAKAAREQAFRDELREQERGDSKDLERAFERQEKEKKKRRKAAEEEAERQKIEQDLAVGRKIPAGFHYDD